ncbi:D-arabinono-1,4-lactone oxidase [Acinetobacter shaoyimingii]|uniref:FAD-binding protein n=1 Tax=Acinetobacter shaoyimingii TaxID=2715164 RepID=A0A6G8RT99_9GAMM|nr:D-arabinono-1,4-lactone oxidase [Acinetobacter shaoyimingii]QIO05050.1 FAD-binding protein [Acinetobacter shaoyimingii]
MNLNPDHGWSNWSGYCQSQPKKIVTPNDLEQLQTMVAEHEKIRVVGAGHSFTPLVQTNETLISLDRFSNVHHVDQTTCQSTLGAGIRLYDLGAYLQPYDQALINQGDIDQQSLAGAISTGTHGTGADLQCLSAYVEGFELLKANGELIQCSRNENIDIFHAGRVALGSLGILTKITMQNRAKYKLKERIQLAPVQESLDQFTALMKTHRHLEYFIFPYTNQLMLKTLDLTEDEIRPRVESKPSEDQLLKWCCEISQKMPFLTGYLQNLVGVFVKPTEFVNWSSEIFASPRDTKFNEMEYQIPIEHGIECVKEVIATFKKFKINSFFPIELRVVKGDDIWLSPFYQQDSISISVHQYFKQSPRKVFDLIEPIFQKYHGRPHWAKMHQLNQRQLKALYPKWNDFIEIGAAVDPQKKFLNPYLEHLMMAKI